MAPPAANIDEQPEFAEMKPMPIFHQDLLQQGNFNPDTEAQLQQTLNNILALQQKILMAQSAPSVGDTAPGEAALPETSATSSAIESQVDEEEFIEDDQVTPVAKRGRPSLPTNYDEGSSSNSNDIIRVGATFHSFAEFQAALTAWKEAGNHPMRIASSEALKDPSGVPDQRFKYKHAVYHCAHHGKPRYRVSGEGARPNQTYLPCGCPAVFRINFNYHLQVLRVTSMNMEHKGHPMTPKHYKIVSQNRSAKRSLRNAEKDSESQSPTDSLPGTPYPIKQEEDLDMEIEQQQKLLEDLKRQQQERMGTDTPQSSQSKSSGLISSHDYGMNNPEPDYEEAKPAKIPKMEITPQNFTRTSRQIRVPARSREEGYEVGQTHEDQKQEEEYEDTVIDVPALPGLAKIAPGAEYKSWSDFERAFTHWKDTGKHPMRVASSETMKDLNGIQNPTYRYKYVTYHCAHYGVPRMRGNGLRQNQSYQSCGCHSMLRLIYSFESQTLRVSCMTPEHNGHARDRQFYEKIAARLSAAKNRSGTANYINSAASSPAMNSPMVQSPFGTPANGDDEKLKELLGMLTATNQATMQLLQQSQGGAIPNLASILGPQLGALGILPGIGLQGAVQQADGTVRDVDNNINKL